MRGFLLLSCPSLDCLSMFRLQKVLLRLQKILIRL